MHESSSSSRTAQPQHGEPLTIIAADDHMKPLNILLYWEAGPSPEEIDLNAALVEASRAGHEEAIKLLLDVGADVNHTGTDDGSALLAASRNGHKGAVKLLLEAGAAVEMVHKYGKPLRLVLFGFDFQLKGGHPTINPDHGRP